MDDNPDFDVIDDWYVETFDVPAGVTEVTLPEITVTVESHDVGGFSSYYDFSAGEWVSEAVKLDP